MKGLVKMKKILIPLLILAMLLSLWGCQQPTDTGDGEKMHCTLEIRCDVLLEHLDELTKEKAELVPEDGVILEKVQVEFEEGQSVFDVFRKTLRERKIHFEYVDASAYSAIYIEGIGNLYEFDCGAQSGWVYAVNDVYPSLGCSSYTLKDGDEIVFRYTCNLGADVATE